VTEKDTSGYILGYYVSHEAWYKDVIAKPTIQFGLFNAISGTCGEMSMIWLELGGKLTPQLRVHDDAWYVFNTFADKLTPILAEYDDRNITPTRFANILDSIGFTDLTEREQKGDGRKTLYNLKETRERLDKVEQQCDGLISLLAKALEQLEEPSLDPLEHVQLEEEIRFKLKEMK
jgi:hypothetical protein